jgi:hypothetical protein
VIVTVLFIVAAVLFAVASFGPGRTPLHLGWAGAFFLALALAIQSGVG